MTPLDATTLAVNLGASVVAIVIGARLAKRQTTGRAQRASTLFSVWWIALGIDTILNAAPKLFALAGFTPAWLAPAIAYPAVVAICVMFWGLVYYLAYLFTGREGATRAVTAFYAATLVGAIAFIASLRPIDLDAQGGIVYANEPSPLAAILWSLSLLVPPTIGALAYGSLVLRVKERFRRFRIGVVSASMFVWFSTAIVVNAPGASDGLRIAGIAIGVTALTGLVLAYFPPAPLVRWLGATPADLHPVPRGTPDAWTIQQIGPAERAKRAEALVARVRDLV